MGRSIWFSQARAERSWETLCNVAHAGGDQGLLNQYFGEKWNTDIKYHLPFTYNCAASQAYFFAPAFQKFKGDIKILHYLGQGMKQGRAAVLLGRMTSLLDTSLVEGSECAADWLLDAVIGCFFSSRRCSWWLEAYQERETHETLKRLPWRSCRQAVEPEPRERRTRQEMVDLP